MSQALRPLPILESVTEVYRAFFAHLRYLPRLALLPFSATFGLIVLSYMTDADGIEFLLDLIGIAPMALFAFLWHRLLLYGPNPETLRVLPPLDATFRRFLIYTLMLAAPLLILQEMMPAPPPPGADEAQIESHARGQAGLLMLLFPLLIAYILAVVGLSLLFPATAAGKTYGPADSWRDTRGVKFAIFMIIMLTLIPVEVAMWALLFPVGMIEAATQLVAPSLLVIALSTYLVLPLSTGVLTQAYKTRFGWTPGPPSTT